MLMMKRRRRSKVMISNRIRTSCLCFVITPIRPTTTGRREQKYTYKRTHTPSNIRLVRPIVVETYTKKSSKQPTHKHNVVSALYCLPETIYGSCWYKSRRFILYHFKYCFDNGHNTSSLLRHTITQTEKKNYTKHHYKQLE